MSKIYQFGKYVEVDNTMFKYPHEDVTRVKSGHKVKFTHCHRLGPDMMLVGYSSRKKRWAEILDDGFQWFDKSKL